MAKDTSHTYTIQRGGGVMSRYTNVVEPRESNFDDGKKGYEATLFIPERHPDYHPLLKVALLVAQRHDPRAASIADVQSPIQDGDEYFKKYPNADWAAGGIVLKAHALYDIHKDLTGQLVAGEKHRPPKLSIFSNGTLVDLHTDLEKAVNAQPYFYHGVQVFAEVAFVPYKGFGGGITCYLNSLCSLGTGERRDGSAAATKFGEGLAHIQGAAQFDPFARA